MRVRLWGCAGGNGEMKSISVSLVSFLEFWKVELIRPVDCHVKKSEAGFWVPNLTRERRQGERACVGRLMRSIRGMLRVRSP